MSIEYIDVFSNNYTYIGKADKKTAHKEGLWHRVFTCLIVDSQTKTVYFQKKHPHLYEFERPDYLDISVGGHYKAGEQIEDGIRELYEETNISNATFQDLVPLGIRQTSATISPNYLANEFQHIFLYDLKDNTDSLLKTNDEVSAFVELSIDCTIDLFIKKANRINGKLLYFRDGEYLCDAVDISIEDFVPAYLNGDKFLLRLLIAAKRYIYNQYENGLLFW